MPILTKEVEVKVNQKTVEHYKSLGYEIPMRKASEKSYKRHKKEFVYDFGKSFMVKVEDLTKGSNVEIEAICDMCNKNKIKLTYERYNRSIEKTGSLVCQECLPKKIRCIINEKYGVNNAAQVEEFKEKSRKTSLERYGVDHYAKTQECQDKMKNTMKERYGVETVFHMDDFKEKVHNTCVEKYGEDYRKFFTKKAQETFYNRTGYLYTSQSPEVQMKKKQTCMEKFGYEYSLQSPDVRKKIIQTNQERYGCDVPTQSPEIREKIAKSFYKNSSKSVSKQQLYIFNIYNSESKMVELNYPISRYNVDICFPEEKLYVEYDGGGHNLNVTIGNMTQKEFDQREIIRNNIIKREGYKQMRIISTSDLLPSDTILLQMLTKAKEYFSTYPQHSWYEFNIDTSLVYNAEHKEGVFFDYGELRKITEVA